MVLLRRILGDTLRAQRLAQRRTLREVSTAAKVSLGYLSEVERGQKEASSELLSSICDALGVRLAEVLRDVSDTLEIADGTSLAAAGSDGAQAGAQVSALGAVVPDDASELDDIDIDIDIDLDRGIDRGIDLDAVPQPGAVLAPGRTIGHLDGRTDAHRRVVYAA